MNPPLFEFGSMQDVPRIPYRLMGHLMKSGRTDYIYGIPLRCRANEWRYAGEKAYRIEPPPDDVRRRGHAVFPGGRWKHYHKGTRAEEALDGTYGGILKWTAISMMDAGDILNKGTLIGSRSRPGRNKYPWED